MQSKQTCFCGTNLAFEACCQPLINQNKRAQTPEQLMRSRFSAYVTGEYQYIFATYAKQSQSQLTEEDIQHSGEDSHWLALVIYTSDIVANVKEQFVEFSAFYIADDNLYEMREKSRFVLEEINSRLDGQPNDSNAQWRYVDGDIIKHCLLEKVTRKQICPCNNYPTAWPSSITKQIGKKYKQCCGKWHRQHIV